MSQENICLMIRFDFFRPIKDFFGSGTWTVESRRVFKTRIDQKNFWYYFNEHVFAIFIPLHILNLIAYGWYIPEPIPTALSILIVTCMFIPLLLCFLFGYWLKKFNLSQHDIFDWWWIIFHSTRYEQHELFERGFDRLDVSNILQKEFDAESINKYAYSLVSQFVYLYNPRDSLYLKLKYY
jgi:hypothetical protein